MLVLRTYRVDDTFKNKIYKDHQKLNLPNFKITVEWIINGLKHSQLMNLQQKIKKSLFERYHLPTIAKGIFRTKYFRMDRIKFMEDSL